MKLNKIVRVTSIATRKFLVELVKENKIYCHPKNIHESLIPHIKSWPCFGETNLGFSFFGNIKADGKAFIYISLEEMIDLINSKLPPSSKVIHFQNYNAFKIIEKLDINELKTLAWTAGLNLNHYTTHKLLVQGIYIKLGGFVPNDFETW